MLRAYKNLDDETITMMLDQIRNNAERLQRLVENFLLLHKLKWRPCANKPPISFRTTTFI